MSCENNANLKNGLESGWSVIIEIVVLIDSPWTDECENVFHIRQRKLQMASIKLPEYKNTNGLA